MRVVKSDDATLSPQDTWLTPALRSLASIARLRHNWDSYQAEAPSELAIQLARNVLGSLVTLDFQPTSIDPSAEGGVCISFLKQDRYGDIECFNSGAVLAVTSKPNNEPTVWEVDPDHESLRIAASEIRLFLKR